MCVCLISREPACLGGVNVGRMQSSPLRSPGDVGRRNFRGPERMRAPAFRAIMRAALAGRDEAELIWAPETHLVISIELH